MWQKIAMMAAGKMFSSKKNRNKDDDSGIFDSVGSLVKSGGIVGLLVMLFKMLIGRAQESMTAEEWNDTTAQFRHGVNGMCESFGVVPVFGENTLSQERMARMSDEQRDDLAKRVAAAIPEEHHDQLAQIAQDQIERLKTNGKTDRFGLSDDAIPLASAEDEATIDAAIAALSKVPVATSAVAKQRVL